MTYTEVKLRAKLEYLTRLLKLRVKLMSYIEDVEVGLKNNVIRVRWIGKVHPKKISQFEEIEFPVSHLSKRIEHYKRKFRSEWAKRNNK